MRTIITKLTAVLLCLAMLVGLLPASVIAETTADTTNSGVMSESTVSGETYTPGSPLETDEDGKYIVNRLYSPYEPADTTDATHPLLTGNEAWIDLSQIYYGSPANPKYPITKWAANTSVVNVTGDAFPDMDLIDEYLWAGYTRVISTELLSDGTSVDDKQNGVANSAEHATIVKSENTTKTAYAYNRFDAMQGKWGLTMDENVASVSFVPQKTELFLSNTPYFYFSNEQTDENKMAISLLIGTPVVEAKKVPSYCEPTAEELAIYQKIANGERYINGAGTDMTEYYKTIAHNVVEGDCYFDQTTGENYYLSAEDVATWGGSEFRVGDNTYNAVLTKYTVMYQPDTYTYRWYTVTTNQNMPGIESLYVAEEGSTATTEDQSMIPVVTESEAYSTVDAALAAGYVVPEAGWVTGSMTGCIDFTTLLDVLYGETYADIRYDLAQVRIDVTGGASRVNYMYFAPASETVFTPQVSTGVKESADNELAEGWENGATVSITNTPNNKQVITIDTTGDNVYTDNQQDYKFEQHLRSIKGHGCTVDHYTLSVEDLYKHCHTYDDQGNGCHTLEWVYHHPGDGCAHNTNKSYLNSDGSINQGALMAHVADTRSYPDDASVSCYGTTDYSTKVCVMLQAFQSCNRESSSFAGKDMYDLVTEYIEHLRDCRGNARVSWNSFDQTTEYEPCGYNHAWLSINEVIRHGSADVANSNHDCHAADCALVQYGGHSLTNYYNHLYKGDADDVEYVTVKIPVRKWINVLSDDRNLTMTVNVTDREAIETVVNENGEDITDTLNPTITLWGNKYGTVGNERSYNFYNQINYPIDVPLSNGVRYSRDGMLAVLGDGLYLSENRFYYSAATVDRTMGNSTNYDGTISSYDLLRSPYMYDETITSAGTGGYDELKSTMVGYVFITHFSICMPKGMKLTITEMGTNGNPAGLNKQAVDSDGSIGTSQDAYDGGSGVNPVVDTAVIKDNTNKTGTTVQQNGVNYSVKPAAFGPYLPFSDYTIGDLLDTTENTIFGQSWYDNTGEDRSEHSRIFALPNADPSASVTIADSGNNNKEIVYENDLLGSRYHNEENGSFIVYARVTVKETIDSTEVSRVYGAVGVMKNNGNASTEGWAESEATDTHFGWTLLWQSGDVGHVAVQGDYRNDTLLNFDYMNNPHGDGGTYTSLTEFLRYHPKWDQEIYEYMQDTWVYSNMGGFGDFYVNDGNNNIVSAHTIECGAKHYTSYTKPNADTLVQFYAKKNTYSNIEATQTNSDGSYKFGYSVIPMYANQWRNRSSANSAWIIGAWKDGSTVPVDGREAIYVAATGDAANYVYTDDDGDGYYTYRQATDDEKADSAITKYKLVQGGQFTGAELYAGVHNTELTWPYSYGDTNVMTNTTDHRSQASSASVFNSKAMNQNFSLGVTRTLSEPIVASVGATSGTYPVLYYDMDTTAHAAPIAVLIAFPSASTNNGETTYTYDDVRMYYIHTKDNTLSLAAPTNVGEDASRVSMKTLSEGTNPDAGETGYVSLESLIKESLTGTIQLVGVSLAIWNDASTAGTQTSLRRLEVLYEEDDWLDKISMSNVATVDSLSETIMNDSGNLLNEAFYYNQDVNLDMDEVTINDYSKKGWNAWIQTGNGNIYHSNGSVNTSMSAGDDNLSVLLSGGVEDAWQYETALGHLRVWVPAGADGKVVLTADRTFNIENYRYLYYSYSMRDTTTKLGVEDGTTNSGVQVTLKTQTGNSGAALVEAGDRWEYHTNYDTNAWSDGDNDWSTYKNGDDQLVARGARDGSAGYISIVNQCNCTICSGTAGTEPEHSYHASANAAVDLYEVFMAQKDPNGDGDYADSKAFNYVNTENPDITVESEKEIKQIVFYLNNETASTAEFYINYIYLSNTPIDSTMQQVFETEEQQYYYMMDDTGDRYSARFPIISNPDGAVSDPAATGKESRVNPIVVTRGDTIYQGTYYNTDPLYDTHYAEENKWMLNQYGELIDSDDGVIDDEELATALDPVWFYTRLGYDDGYTDILDIYRYKDSTNTVVDNDTTANILDMSWTYGRWFPDVDNTNELHLNGMVKDRNGDLVHDTTDTNLVVNSDTVGNLLRRYAVEDETLLRSGIEPNSFLTYYDAQGGQMHYSGSSKELSTEEYISVHENDNSYFVTESVLYSYFGWPLDYKKENTVEPTKYGYTFKGWFYQTGELLDGGWTDTNDNNRYDPDADTLLDGLWSDANSDGLMQLTEIPEEYRQYVSDTDNDGVITPEKQLHIYARKMDVGVDYFYAKWTADTNFADTSTDTGKLQFTAEFLNGYGNTWVTRKTDEDFQIRIPGIAQIASKDGASLVAGWTAYLKAADGTETVYQILDPATNTLYTPTYESGATITLKLKGKDVTSIVFKPILENPAQGTDNKDLIGTVTVTNGKLWLYTGTYNEETKEYGKNNPDLHKIFHTTDEQTRTYYNVPRNVVFVAVPDEDMIAIDKTKSYGWIMENTLNGHTLQVKSGSDASNPLRAILSTNEEYLFTASNLAINISYTQLTDEEVALAADGLVTTFTGVDPINREATFYSQYQRREDAQVVGFGTLYVRGSSNYTTIQDMLTTYLKLDEESIDAESLQIGSFGTAHSAVRQIMASGSNTSDQYGLSFTETTGDAATMYMRGYVIYAVTGIDGAVSYKVVYSNYIVGCTIQANAAAA